jgi:hypothetical protein
MTIEILQSSTQAPLLFFLTATSDHITGLTGATPTVTLSKAGAAFASPSGAVTEIANGWYKVAGNATDTNTLGPIALHATATSADPCDLVVANIVAYNPQVTSLGLSLAKTTNITGFNDITAAAAATGVWQDATAGDFTVASSIGKSLFTSGNAPGAASGLALVGSNVGSATSVSGSVGSVTGNVGGNVVGSVASVTGAVGSVTAAVTVGTNNDKSAYGINSNIKTNQALANFAFLITDSTTHAPKTGAVIGTVTRSIDGGAFAAGGLSAVTEVGAGIYVVNFAAGDLNGKNITLRVTATAADDVLERIVTQP